MNSWIKLLFLVSVHMKNNDTFSVLYVCVCMLGGESGTSVLLTGILKHCLCQTNQEKWEH